MQEPQEQPTDPYNPDYLTEDLQTGADPFALIQSHPVASAIIALLIVIAFVWLVRLSRRANRKQS